MYVDYIYIQCKQYILWYFFYTYTGLYRKESKEVKCVHRSLLSFRAKLRLVRKGKWLGIVTVYLPSVHLCASPLTWSLIRLDFHPAPLVEMGSHWGVLRGPWLRMRRSLKCTFFYFISGEASERRASEFLWLQLDIYALSDTKTKDIYIYKNTELMC